MAFTFGEIIIGHLSRVSDDALTSPRTPTDGVTWTVSSLDREAWVCYDAVILERDFSDGSITSYDITPFDLYATNTLTLAGVKLALVVSELQSGQELIVYCGNAPDYDTADDSMDILENLLEDSRVVVVLSGHNTQTPEPITEFQEEGEVKHTFTTSLLDGENTSNEGTTDDPNYVAYATVDISASDSVFIKNMINNADETGHQLILIANSTTSFFNNDSSTRQNLTAQDEDDWILALSYLGAQGNGGGGDDLPNDLFAAYYGGADTGGGPLERQDHSKMEAG